LTYHARTHAQVKTTAPKRYCVRPNCCLVRAGEQVEVKIIMQALKEIPPPEQMWKDKFLIQVMLGEREREKERERERAWTHTHREQAGYNGHTRTHNATLCTHTQQAGNALNAGENADLGFRFSGLD
jgi:hypothetical protein